MVTEHQVYEMSYLYFAALFLLIGVCTMAEKCHEYFENQQSAWIGVTEYDWSFYLAITSLILTTASLVLLLLEIVIGRESDY